MVTPAKAFDLAPTGLYQKIPESIQKHVRDVYFRYVYGSTSDEIERNFIQNFFESRSEYQNLRSEFFELGGDDVIESAQEKHQDLTGGALMGEVPITTISKYYALIRSIQPEVAVETGVCNGVSTYGILLALHENGNGTLTSVDYPYRENDDIQEYRDDTTDQFSGSTVPRGHDPGWFIPDELCENWNLVLGKSQEELPKLRGEINEIDFFVHDSEHTLPCMMFEFELAWEWLATGGVLLSDDILWGGHGAFDLFVEERCSESNYGYMEPNTGFAVR